MIATGGPAFPRCSSESPEAWEHDHANIVASAAQAIEALREYSSSTPKPGGAGQGEISACYNQLARTFDDELGGFGGAPKFPRPVTLNLLFRIAAREEREMQRKHAASAWRSSRSRRWPRAACTIISAAASIATRWISFWHVPHFEKMLYDQAQLASFVPRCLSSHARSRLGKDRARHPDYVQRDMTDQGGRLLFRAKMPTASSKQGKPEHGEGAFYVWTKAEIVTLLGEDAAKIFNRFYGVEAEGNAPAGSDPQGEFTGKNTLIQRLAVADGARIFGKSEAELEQSLAESKRKLFEVRAQRPRPHLDDKIITAWNGLMISAFARAAQVARTIPAIAQAAQRSAQFIREQLWKDGRLLRNYRQGASDVGGFAEDYASLIQGLLDLYEADFDVGHLQWALELQEKMDALFWDEQNGGYFSTHRGQTKIFSCA